MSRIAFFVNSMEGGGAERVAALLCNRWAERGHDVLLIPTFSGRGECLYPLDERIELKYLADRVGTTHKTVWSMGRRLWAMRSLVQEFSADAVLSFLPQVNVATLLATRGLAVPVVVAERVYPAAVELGWAWAQLRRLTYPWASRVIVQTCLGLSWLLSAAPRSEGVVVPNPCVFPLPVADPHVDPDTIVKRGRRLIVGVGRLEKQKGFDDLIGAFQRLAPDMSDWDLAIIGEGDERAALEAQVASSGLWRRIHLPGRVGNVGDWYARADVYAMSSRFEGFPNTLMESMAYGVPAVSFNCPTGPADLIEEGVNGYLVPLAEGGAGLAERLGALMSNEDERTSMSERAVEVRERFSIERVGAEWDVALGLGN